MLDFFGCEKWENKRVPKTVFFFSKNILSSRFWSLRNMQTIIFHIFTSLHHLWVLPNSSKQSHSKNTEKKNLISIYYIIHLMTAIDLWNIFMISSTNGQMWNTFWNDWKGHSDLASLITSIYFKHLSNPKGFKERETRCVKSQFEIQINHSIVIFKWSTRVMFEVPSTWKIIQISKW